LFHNEKVFSLFFLTEENARSHERRLAVAVKIKSEETSNLNGTLNVRVVLEAFDTLALDHDLRFRFVNTNASAADSPFFTINNGSQSITLSYSFVANEIANQVLHNKNKNGNYFACNDKKYNLINYGFYNLLSSLKVKYGFYNLLSGLKVNYGKCKIYFLFTKT